MSFDSATDRRLNVDGRGDGLRLVTPPIPARIRVPVAGLHPSQAGNAIDTQLLAGEPVHVFARNESRADARWLVKSLTDGYVGHVAREALGEPHRDGATHHVVVPRTFAFAEPDMKCPGPLALSLGSRMVVTDERETRGTTYQETEYGWIMQGHVEPFTQCAADPVAVAEQLVHTPYLWGGRSAFGIDCSGLVQLCHMMAGNAVLRDTDMQAATIGTEIPLDRLQRGDLVFWKGHVAMMLDRHRIIHANGRTMSVFIEPLAEAVERIARLHGQPTICRRP